MKPLRINYASRPGRRWAPYALLCAAVLFAAEVGLTAWPRIEEAVEAVAGATPRPVPPAEGVSVEDELKDANQLIGRLSMPWSSLFQALEKAHSAEVALLTLQPDAQRRVLQVTGEAKAYAEVLSYVSRLRNDAQLTSVHLVSTEVREDDPHRPILFSVAASWAKIE